MSSIQEWRDTFAPIVAELRAAGYNIEEVSDLYIKGTNLKAAIPILLKWLPLLNSWEAKEVLVRALANRQARPIAAPVLIEEFKKAPPSRGSSFGWTIGDSLTHSADDSVFDDIVELATDKRYGSSRERVVVALGNMKNPKAVDVLIELLEDDEVAGHALNALRKLTAVKARPQIEKFLNHPRTWWRNEAKKAIAKIDKAIEKQKQQ